MTAKSKQVRVIIAGLFVLAGLIVLHLVRLPDDRTSSEWPSERASAAVCLLKSLNGQRFASDTDGNGVKDYETRSIAALCALAPATSAAATNLISELPSADAGILGQMANPLHGYLYSFLPLDALGHTRAATTGFAICAWPAKAQEFCDLVWYSDESGRVWRKPAEDVVLPILRALAIAELREGGWTEIH